MPNPNYKAGRRLEYEVKDLWEAQGFLTIRASGSHGAYDIIGFRWDRKPAFIQCKRVSTEGQRNTLLKKFKQTTPSEYYHQVLAVKVKGKSLETFTI